jgi:hypothetical protein
MDSAALAPRCGECDHCKMVETSKPLFMPNPPFTHASTFSVMYWNQLLCDNPCDNWPRDVASHWMNIIMRGSDDVRPKPDEEIWVSCPGCDMWLRANDHEGQTAHMESLHPEIVEQRLRET